MSDDLSLEKLKIAERLSALEISFKEDLVEKRMVREKLTEAILTLTTTTKKLDEILRGDGENNTGVVSRLRSLEDAEKKRASHINVVWASIIGLACKSIWDWLHGK